MSPEPFDSRAKAPPAKRWEKGYGDENDPASDSVEALNPGPPDYNNIVLNYSATLPPILKWPFEENGNGKKPRS